MSQEREAKFKVAGFSAVLRRLRGAGAKHLGTVLQTDRYFDTPAGRLRKADRGVRIRLSRRLAGPGGLDPRALLTFKGPRAPHGKLKVRREVQTYVDDAAAAAAILEALGLVATMTLRKRRASYRLGRCRVELDELPYLGRFVEIEGPSRRAIEAARDLLGLAGPAITTPYTQMVRERG